MSQTVWLVNLFGTPCTPTSFNPDNSLASLAGSLKQVGYSPRIFDFQTISMFRNWIPYDLGQRSLEIATLARSKALSERDYARVRSFNDELTRHQLGVVDRLADELIQRARTEKPLFIGLKLYSGEGALFNRQLAARLKKSLKIPLVGGGPLVRVAGRQYFEMYSEIDYLLSGECDRSIVSFARFCEGRGSTFEVAGLIHRDEAGTIHQNPIEVIHDMSTLPDPCYDRDVYPCLYQPGEKIMCFQLDESRGCPNSCNFCVHPAINGNRFRSAPAKKIIAQIKELQKTFGAYAFRFAGSNTPKKFLREFSEEAIRQDLKIMYSCFASINTTDSSVIAPLRKSGMAGVFIGVESLDPHVLSFSFNKKGQPFTKVNELVRGFIDSGIFTTTSWIYPAPFSTPESRNQVKNFLIDVYGGRSVDEGSAILVPPALVPGTAWFRSPEKFGFQMGDADPYYKGYIDLIFKSYLPAQLMGNWDFTLHGKTFNQLGAECDQLRDELEHAGVPLGLSDDWMLVGRLSGYSMEKFRDIVTRCFVTGEADELERIVLAINENSRRQVGGGKEENHLQVA